MITNLFLLNYLIFLIFCKAELISSNQILNQQSIDDHFIQLQHLLNEILHRTKVKRCYAIITDKIHSNLFNKQFFELSNSHKSNFFFKILDSEDMTFPNYETIKVMHEVKKNDCDLIFLLIVNGIQMKNFLNFIDENRILNTKSKYVLFYDHRILDSTMLHIWRKIIFSVLIRKIEGNILVSNETTRFELLTVPYPNILKNTFYGKKINEWKYGRLQRRQHNLFEDKTNNLEGTILKVAAYEHLPMVIKNSETNSYSGVEVNILNTLKIVMNFTIDFYETSDKEQEKWGRRLPNGSYSGLIGEIVNRRADFAIGELYMNEFYTSIMDFSIAHSIECLTFLTPESSTDNSWQTFIKPLSDEMWAGVILGLLVTGTVFYAFSKIHYFNVRVKTIKTSSNKKSNIFKRIFGKNLKVKGKTNDKVILTTETGRINFKNLKSIQKVRKDIFDDFSNCILLTYSMLLLVSLPKMPDNWPLRVLSGWYWIYCILIAVTYRASFTAILANPSPRITIDSIEELANSNIIPGAWGEENKKFFTNAFDEYTQKIGNKLEEIDDIDASTIRIAKGELAFFGNAYFLRYLRAEGVRQNSVTDGKQVKDEMDDALHIMKNCIINMPISIGLEKNSPLKPNVDKYLRRLKEAGLLAKWLKDTTDHLPAEEEAPQEALVDLKKFWSSFVILAIGYFFSAAAFIGEKLHFKYIVERHPMYDKLNPKKYYNFIKNY